MREGGKIIALWNLCVVLLSLQNNTLLSSFFLGPHVPGSFHIPFLAPVPISRIHVILNGMRGSAPCSFLKQTVFLWTVLGPKRH